MKSGITAAVAAVCAASFLCGCAGETAMTMSNRDAQGYKGQPLTIVRHSPTNGFYQLTPSAAAFGALGAVAAMSVSEGLVRDNGLVDPAFHVSEQLAPAVQSQMQTASTAIVEDPESKSIKPEQLAAMAGNKGLVLDVRTRLWNVGYFPFNWTHYRVMYFATAHLVDAASGKVIAQAPCETSPKNDDGAPTYDELYADKAALLKSKLLAAGDECFQQMQKTLFTEAASQAAK